MSSRIARAHIVVPHTPTTTSATRDPAPTQPFWRVSVNSGRYNAVIAQATEGFRKQLFSNKPSGERPQLVVAADEAAQAEYVVKRVLEYREEGIDLKRQAVL